MAQFASDAFTDADNTLLSAHGTNWTKHATGSDSGSDIKITSNRIRANAATLAAAYYHSGSPASADYSVSGDVYVVNYNNTNDSGVLARVDVSAATWYLARLTNSGTTSANWQLFKRISGSYTQLGSNSGQTIANANSYGLKLECVGSAIKVYVNGSASASISVTDSAITAAGKAGVRDYNGSSGDIALGFHLDNFSGDDVGGAVASIAFKKRGRNFAHMMVR